MTGPRETATQLDSAIDILLRQRDAASSSTEGDLVTTARLLRDSLPRFHPRFGFEELLAARLAAARLRERPPEPTPIRPLLSAPGAAAGVVESAERRRRGLVAGGAIASGVSIAVPIAGAAIVVWRRSRSSGGLL
jgi:hypothetical protein